MRTIWQATPAVVLAWMCFLMPTLAAGEPVATPAVPPAVTPPAAGTGDPATPAKVDMKAADDLRALAQTAIAGLLKAGGSHPIDLVIAGQAQSVDLVGVDEKKNLLYKQFGKKSTLEFKDLSYGQIAAILQALTEDNSPDIAQNNFSAGLLYALEGNSLASSAALTKAFEQNPDLNDKAPERLKALQPIIQALHPTPVGVTLPVVGGSGSSSGPSTPGSPGPPPASLQKTGFEHLGLAG
ncbi:MAG TPA: hypothetical protein VL860_11545, partial [Planctomycetota bacterium]|nr:hypothetical protein [Planctomycetota bacterium]